MRFTIPKEWVLRKCAEEQEWENKMKLKFTRRAVDEFAGHLYDVYSKAVGGVNFKGDPLPSWEEFSTDQTKVKQANAWRAVAEEALESKLE